MSTAYDLARERVQRSGARVTAARVAVLAELLEAGAALTHLELQHRLESALAAAATSGPGGRPVSPAAGPRAVGRVDRVTLYRVLDWLVDTGLAHRVPDPDRVLRFSAQPADHPVDAHHGHFRCTGCHRVFCLADGPRRPDWIDRLLPAGFAAEAIDLTVSGRCAQCVREAAGRREVPGARTRTAASS